MDLGSRRRRSSAEGSDTMRAAQGDASHFLALPDTEALEGSTAANPFWSERARAEHALQQARPRDLDIAGNAQADSAGSSSTELRATPVGVSEADTATVAVSAGAGESAVGAEAMAGQSGGLDTDVDRAPQEADQDATATASATPAPAQVPLGAGSAAQQLGMRPGERLIVEELKNLLVGLYEQNQVLAEGQRTLQRRIDQMENDAMQSATSGDTRDAGATGEGDKGVSGLEIGWTSEHVPYLGRFVPPEERATPDYQAGIEEGLRRAAEASFKSKNGPGGEEAKGSSGVGDPIAPPRRSPSPHTPNGTRVPSGTPPLTPTPMFGSPDRPRREQARILNPVAQPAEWSNTTVQGTMPGDFWDSVGLRPSGWGSVPPEALGPLGSVSAVQQTMDSRGARCWTAFRGAFWISGRGISFRRFVRWFWRRWFEFRDRHGFCSRTVVS